MSDTPAQPATQPPVDGSAPDSSAPNPASSDAVMTDAPASEQAPSSAAAAPSAASNAPSPAPARTGTPVRNGQEPSSSRAGSAHPDTAFTIPEKAVPHGDPVRRYLNTKVTLPLLEGMKKIAKEQPKDPLRVLGEYLLERSKELEGNE